jgi:hypothetical protein|tara:strand:+ start:468 stop:644 length:177 start_codon:yes stop_codon:yes gene_type:complete
MKLTKKEKVFLIYWLSDDLFIAKKDLKRHEYNKEVFKEIKPKVKILSSIIKKIESENQ